MRQRAASPGCASDVVVSVPVGERSSMKRIAAQGQMGV